MKIAIEDKFSISCFKLPDENIKSEMKDDTVCIVWLIVR